MNNFDVEQKIRRNEQLVQKVSKCANDLLEKNYNNINSNTYCIHSYGSAILDSVDENICLWRLICYKRSERIQLYFYTNLEGEILFDNNFFEEATTFSNGSSLVDYGRNNWYIINLEKREKMQISNDMNCKLFQNFMHNSMAVLDCDIKKWGSYSLNPSERVWQREIPFIWDYLALSRDKDIVICGIADKYTCKSNYEYGPYSHMIPDYDKVSVVVRYKIARMLKKSALSL